MVLPGPFQARLLSVNIPDANAAAERLNTKF